MLKFFRDVGDMDQRVAKAREGDAAAFTELVQQHCGMVFTIAFSRLKNREAAEDLTQEVFLRIFLNLDKLAEPRFFTTWASRIARNLASDWAKREQRSSTLLPMVSLEETIASINQIHEREERHALEERDRSKTAEAAILELPEELREVLLLHYSEGMTLRQIAEVRELHPTTIGRQLQLALDAVRARVNDSTFKQTAKSMAAGHKLAARSAAAAVAVTMLSAQSKSAIAAAATLDGAMQMSVASGLAAKATIWSTITSGKALIAAAAVTAAASGGYYVTQQPIAVAQDSPKAPIASSVVPHANAHWAEGHWIGKLQFAKAPKAINIVFVIRRLPDGSFESTGRSPDQGFGKIFGNPAIVAGDSISMEYPSVRATFQGRRVSDNEIKGEFTQGEKLPLVMTRMALKPSELMNAPAIAMEAAKLPPFAGVYASDPKTSATVALSGSSLVVSGRDFPSTPLIPVSENSFVTDDRTVRVNFGRAANGLVDRVTFHTEIGDGKNDVIMRKVR